MPEPSPTHPTELSVVVPVLDEAGNVRPLIDEIVAALDDRARFEIVYVDDGSTDETPERLREAIDDGLPVRVVRHRNRSGQSAAIRSGVAAARGTWVATLDGDGQNDPADIPVLLAERDRLPTAPPVMVCGQRRKRRDTWSKRLSSRVANAVRSGLLRDATPDTGCGLKLFPRDVYLRLPAFDHNHRFLPALFQREGGLTVSVPVNHRPRSLGASKYGMWNRLWVGIVDLVGVWWLQRRAVRVAIEEPIEDPPGPT